LSSRCLLQLLMRLASAVTAVLRPPAAVGK
jgi:hypothetical protein